MSFDYGNFITAGGPAIAKTIGGAFGNSGKPYDAAMDQYNKFIGKGEQAQNPFYQAGKGAIPEFQQWLQTQKDPSAFINNLMGQYNESPFAHYQQQQSMRTAQNVGSASGLTGSTPLMLQAQQNSQNISSQDMNSWLEKVLGVNTQYGQGQQHLMDNGQSSADRLTDMYSTYGGRMGEGAYGSQYGRNRDFSDLIGGGAALAKYFI